MFLHVFLWCNLVIRITVDCKQQKRTDKIQNEWWGNTSRQCGGRRGQSQWQKTVQIFIYAGSSFKLLVFTQVHIFDKTIKIVTPSLSSSHRLQKNQTTFWSCIHFCVVTHTHIIFKKWGRSVLQIMYTIILFVFSVFIITSLKKIDVESRVSRRRQKIGRRHFFPLRHTMIKANF
jgi:hypothetical protein